MKNIIVTTVDSSGVIAKHTLSGNGPTVINATKNANYEFFDNAKGYGPDHIITRRVDNDLKVSFERTGAEDDLVIKDFYTENAANNNSALVGASKEGEPYYYIPDSAEQADFVTQLQDGAIQGNALGGEEFVQPWWIGGLPVLAALGIASIGSSDDSPPPPPTPVVNPPVVTITEDTNNDGIISANELDGTVGFLIEVHETTQVGDTLIITNPDGSMDQVVITQDIKDNGLVLEYAAPANGETIEVKAQVIDQQENASETSSDSAVVDSPAIISLSGDSSVNEDNGPATYTISLDKASDTDTVVTYEVQNQTTDSDDFTGATTATVTIPAGQLSVVVEVGINDDGVYEGDENYNVVITEVTGSAELGNDDTVNTVIIDKDMMPSISVDDVTVSESLMGEDVVATFTVTLSHPSMQTVEVSFNTEDGTAIDGADYNGLSGTVTFAPGETTQTIEVPILDDAYDEADETFNVVLNSPVNATIDHNGIGTITDEEQYPDLVEVSIVDNYDAVNEGDTATFPIELRDDAGNLIIAATDVTVTVEYTGTAINGDDYTTVSTTVTIPAGASSVNLDIETLTDLLDEDLENVIITVTEATGGGFEALGVDADKCVADVDIIDSAYTTIEIDDVTVDEDAGNAVFTVTLTGDAPTADVTVDYATGDVTALDASDYTGVTGTLVFPVGTLTQTITVPILDDNIAELAETYSVTLSNAVNATILNSGVGTITDECHTDLDSVYVSIVDNVDSVYEGEVATFTVELRDADGNLNTAITDVTVDIHYSGVAIDGTDYIGVASVTIPANSSSVGFDITTLDDYIAEGSEIVNIELNSVTGGGFEAIAVDPTKATADMEIVDECCDAESVVVSILDFVTNVVEGGNGVFPIELHDQDGNPISAITDTTVDIHYSGVGIDGTDFTGISTIVIPAGSQSNYLVLETIDDNFAEGSELVNIELFNVSGGGFEAIAVDPDHNTADMNIVDDCDSVFVSILDFTTDVIEDSSGLFPIVLKDADGNAINAVTDITVNIEYSGVAIDGTDFTGIASVVIPAGAQSTNLILQTLDDNIAEGSEIVNIELTSVSGGGFEAIALDPVMYIADMNIVDDCNYPVTVSIFDDVDSIYEGESTTFPISLTNVDGDPQIALTDVTVTIEYTGSATNGDDYTGSFTVVIPAGASSVDLDITSLEDLLAEGDEIVDITISNPIGGGFESIVVDPAANTANVTIIDRTVAIVEVSPAQATEGTDLVHTVTLSAPSVADETYSFALTEGTATENVDYSNVVTFSDGVTLDPVTGEITVPAGVTSFTVTYPTIDDSYADDGETTTLAVGGMTGEGTINDELDPPVDPENPLDPVTVCILDAVDSINENAVDPDNIGSFPIEIHDQNGDLIPAATDVTVDVTYSGVAANGDDFTGVIQVTIPAGAASVNLNLTVIDDLLAEGDEVVNITISNPVGGGFEGIGIDPNANTADMTIIDDERPEITVEPTDAFEGDNLVHMVTLSNPSATDQNYSFALTEGTATENVDYSTTVSFSDGVTLNAVTGEITVPTGVTSFTVTYLAIDDSYADDGETTTLTIGGSSATGTINDEYPPDLVEVSIVDNYVGGDTGDVNEGETAVFPIELRDEDGNLIVAATDVTVTVEYTGMAANGVDYTTVSTTVVIPAGSSSVNLNIETLTDLLDEDLEDVVITLTDVMGGGFEAIAIDADGNVADVNIIDGPYYYVEVDDTNVDEDAGFAEFTVTLTGNVPPTADVTVDYATGDVTAVDGSDYTGVSGTITFVAGTNVFTQTIQVPIIDDVYAELPETYNMTLTNAVNATILNSGVGTIIDEPNAPDLVEVSIVDTVDAINEGASATFPIELRDEDGNLVVATTDVIVTVEYTGMAANGVDYTTVSTTVVIPAGSSSVDLNIETLTDLLDEDLEDVVITLTDVNGGGFESIAIDADGNVADVNIIDGTYYYVEVDDTNVDEDAGFAEFTVTLTGDVPPTDDVTVDYATGNVTAVDGSDYTGVSGTITFVAGTNVFTQTIQVPIIDDVYAEMPETYNMTLTNAVNATILHSGVGTITDEYQRDAVSVSIVDDVDSVNEDAVDPDNIGSFPIEIRDQNGDLAPAETDVTVDVTYSGTATNGDDFTGVIQVTIPAGQSSVDLDLAVIDDLLAEGDEIVDITISNPVGGGFEDIGINPDANTADMTIISDDYIQITVEPTAAFEGDDLVHMVTLSNPSMTDETYSFSLTEGTATENVDYSTAVSFSDGVTFDAITGEITVPAGVTSFTVTYPTIDDSYADDGETTTLTIGGSSATGTINDEYPPDLVEVSIVDNVDSIYEGAVDPDNIGSFPIELRDQNGDLINAATDVTVDVAYSGTADNGDDFTGVIQVTIPAGQSSVNLDLTVIDDLLAEDDEVVDITISNPVGGGFESIAVDSNANTADMTIINDDYITDISIDSQSVNEEDGTMTFTVTLSGPAAVADVTVDYATGDVTAIDGTDYTNTMGTLTFTPGTLTQTITVPILDDSVWEATETCDILLSNCSANANILNSGIGTILDNDLLAVDDSAAAIEAGGINNGSGSTDATGNVLTNDNPDQTDAIVTDIRVGGVEGSGTAGVLGTALVGTYGTLTVNADGTYVYEVNDDDATVQALNDGDTLTESFNYTMTDGTGSDIAVLEIVIEGSNDCAIPTVTSVTVSEEGLTEFDPIPDTTGNNDTTDSTVATGSISFTDVDNFDISDFSIDLAGPTDITVKGETVSWTWDDLTGQLTGQVVIEGDLLDVMTVDVGPITTDGSGGFVADYNTTLLHAIDHPSNDDEDQLDVQFEASVSDGAQSATTNFAVTVEDDRPAQSESNIDIAAATSDSNITIILDTSGSMSIEVIEDGGETRLDLAKAAIVKLLEGYDVAGDVKVQLVTFDTEAEAQPQWMTIDQLKVILPSIVADGWTNYDAALNETINSYDSTGAIFGANNYSYFLTDGEPIVGQGTEDDFGAGYSYFSSDAGIQSGEETLWTTFLNANDIKSYAFAFGPDANNNNLDAELDPIAYDGQIGEQGAADLVRSITDLNQLDDILIDTLPDVVDYGLVNGNLFGADEGHVLTFTLDGITYNYDGSDGSMVASSPSSDIYSYDQSTTTVMINTQAQGIMTLDFETGKYTYETQSLVVDYQEDITFTLIDDDGDSVESTQTIFVYSLTAKDDSVITNDTTGILELDQAVLVGNDNTSLNSEVTTTFDVNGGQTSGVDPVIYTTTDFDDVNSFDYTISENDVSSSALVSIEYQQGDTGTVQGTNASETLVGREGLDDILLGMEGNDILQGKSGNDVLTGGLGEDTFIWTNNDIDGVSTPDLDIITDFEAGDKLNLSDLLQGETIGNAANLADYLNWDAVTEVLSVSADGNFSGGYNAAQSDLNIQIDNYAGDFNNLVDNHII